jgi:alcohol dehydrogenase YqhD (iron-dependent ADH family)
MKESVAGVKRALGNRLATWYAEPEKDSTYVPVSEATEAGREASADLIVAIGGGSVIVRHGRSRSSSASPDRRSTSWRSIRKGSPPTARGWRP